MEAGERKDLLGTQSAKVFFEGLDPGGELRRIVQNGLASKDPVVVTQCLKAGLESYLESIPENFEERLWRAPYDDTAKVA